jgi:hypothetical protein
MHGDLDLYGLGNIDLLLSYAIRKICPFHIGPRRGVLRSILVSERCYKYMRLQNVSARLIVIFNIIIFIMKAINRRKIQFNSVIRRGTVVSTRTERSLQEIIFVAALPRLFRDSSFAI